MVHSKITCGANSGAYVRYCRRRSVAVFNITKMAEKRTFAGKLLSRNQCSATISHTLNEGSILRSCRLWHTTSISLHNYVGAVLFDVISCTSCLRFNSVVQQFEGWRCLHQWAGECNIDSVLGVCWSVRNRAFFPSAPSGTGPPLYQGCRITQTRRIGSEYYSYSVH
jgi:hypothetical protein